MTAGDHYRNFEQRGSSDESWLREKTWLGLRRWTWVLLAYLFVVLMSMYGLWRVQQVSDERDRDIVERIIRDCEITNANRAFATDRLKQILVYIAGTDVTSREQEIIDYVESTRPKPVDCTRSEIPPKEK